MSERPRILYAITSALSYKLLSGQLGFLHDSGFDVAVVSSAPDRPLADVPENVARFEIEVQREISPHNDLRSFLELHRLIKKLRPTVVNVSTPKAGLLAGLAAWVAGVPCRIFTLRGLRSETATGLKRWIIRTTEKISCVCAHRVVCVSPSLAEYVAANKIAPREKIRVLHSSNGVDVTRFRPATDRDAVLEMRKKLDIPENAPVVGFVGRFTRDKGVGELVQACARLRHQGSELRLLLLGDFEAGDPPAPDICRMIENESWIIRPGLIWDSAPYYAVMDIVALPTYREGFPNVSLEAQAMGVPVVTTDAIGARDSIVDGLTGISVAVGDTEALSVAIKTLLENPSLRARLGQAGRERIVREFRNEVVWTDILAIYNELLTTKGFRVMELPLAQSMESAR
jgi:glycosyltransferase involved in cell wall biosynthesis